MRNPRRTATTGAALMIGLSLVTMGYVVGESVKNRLGDLIESSVEADYVVVADEGSVPAPLTDELADTGAFSAVTGFRYDDVRLGGEVVETAAADLSTLDALFAIEVSAGSLPAADTTDVVVIHRDLADDLAVDVGDTLPAEFASGASTELEVAAVYDDATVLEDPLVPFQVFDDGGADTSIEWVAATLGDDVTAAEAAPLVAVVQAAYPSLSIDTAAEFREQFESTIDSALMVVNVLLALAIIIALIGIANTLALSVHERTREIGLLRAVGMTRGETRRMVRWEAALVALFGAVLGVALGVMFGWGVVNALPADDFGGAFAVPVAPIVQVVAIATIATLAAAALPARRAGRLDVLRAISEG